jgi:hypothetical protein
LRDVRFFDPAETQPRPDDFATTIVQGRTYDLDELDAQHPVHRRSPPRHARSRRARRSEFGNGGALYAKAGESIGTPSRRIDKPAREFLQWQREMVFKQSA